MKLKTTTSADHPLNGDIRARAKAQAKFPKAPPPPKAKPKKRKQSKAGKKLVARGRK